MKENIKQELAEKYFKDIFHNLGNHNDLFSITLIMQELYIENMRLYGRLNKDTLTNFALNYHKSIMNIVENYQREQ